MKNPIELSVFSSRLNAVCDEMGASLRRSAFSPNIKDRLDYSCAIFDVDGFICAQAAHIPVHLGSMAYAMKGIVQSIVWGEGDIVVVNDPYQGGTHLPDVTVIAPVFVESKLVAFTVNRAHHANIGCDSPGSMPIAKHLSEEGVIIPPSYLLKAGQWQTAILSKLAGGAGDVKLQGDFLAQVSAAQLGADRLGEMLLSMGTGKFASLLDQLNHYGEALALESWRSIPNGVYDFIDYMDGDGKGASDIPIHLTLSIDNGQIVADFTETGAQVDGNINCPISVAAAAVFYCFRCLLPDYAPCCAGIFRPISIKAPLGRLVNARYPAAVAAGNVETSSRIVDVVFGALAQALPGGIPAASQGTMNNLAMGAKSTDGHAAWDYYETVAGGCGAGSAGPGLSARHSHMTNTLNTPIESIEAHYPVQVNRYQVRKASGGDGQYRGGDGVIKEYRFTGAAQLTLLTERRSRPPWGLAGAQPGMCGRNLINGKEMPGKVSVTIAAGDVLTIETPGGGGWNSPVQKG